MRGSAHQGSGPNGFSELTVEGMVLAVRRLPPGSPVLDAVQRVRPSLQLCGGRTALEGV